MAGANHPMAGVSTFPFTIFGGDWAQRTLDLLQSIPSRGDTVVGNDVWLGYGAMSMPGVRIGDGAVVASASVVGSDVPPYAIVAGNPAHVVRRRFEDEDVERLQRAARWSRPLELITEHVRTIMAGTPAEVAALARQHGLLGPAPGQP